MKRIAKLVLLAAMAAATPLWAADVNDVKARQRWPSLMSAQSCVRAAVRCRAARSLSSFSRLRGYERGP